MASEVMDRLNAIGKEIETLKKQTTNQPHTEAPPPKSWIQETSTPPRTFAPKSEQPPPPSQPSASNGNSAPPSQPQLSAWSGTPAPNVGHSHGTPNSGPSAPGHPSSQANGARPSGLGASYGPNVDHFHLGSLGSPLTRNSAQWAPGAGSENRALDPRE